MPLPIPALPAGTIELAGTRVDYHSLSRHQALRLHEFRGREDEAEDFMVSCACDISIEDAHAWRDAVHFDVAGQLVDAIIAISGLEDEDDKPEPEGDAPDGPKG